MALGSPHYIQPISERWINEYGSSGEGLWLLHNASSALS